MWGLAPSAAWRDLSLHPPCVLGPFLTPAYSPRALPKEPGGWRKREGEDGEERAAMGARGASVGARPTPGGSR